MIAEDLTSADVKLDPAGYFGRLRETEPVHWNPQHKMWVVTRHEDVLWVTRNHQLFSSADPFGQPEDTFPPIHEADWELARSRHMLSGFIVFDRPEHQVMRQAIHQWFTPRAIEKWRERLRITAQRLIDEHFGDGQIEIKSEFATPLPLTTICWMLGVPEGDAAHLQALTDIALGDGSDPARVRVAHEAFVELRDYFEPLVEARAKDPGDDLVSMLAEVERRGTYTRTQCLATIILILQAGHVTTLTLITNATLAFIRHPDAWDVLREDPDGICASATEECLRYDPPLMSGVPRACKEDLELHGQTLRAGDRIFWSIAAANRDPRVFDDPDVFDITRTPNPHLTFGHGIHHCLGAALARTEGQEALRVLADRVPRLTLLDDEVEYLPRGLNERELRQLNVGWS